jgi:TonB-dependent receptor
VYKTGQALLPSGGIGATINVKTRRPFDTPGTQASFGVKALSDSSNEAGEDITPEVSGLFSWTNDGETLGFGLFGAYAERDSGASMGQTNDWVVQTADNIMGKTNIVATGEDPANFVNMPPDGALFAIPQDSRYDVADLTSKRLNAQAVMQFRPTESLTMTLDYTYFENAQTEMRYEQTNWFGTPFNHLTFQTDDEGKFYHAIYMQENQNGTKDMGFEQTNRGQKDNFDSIGFNLEWALTENGTLKFDAHTDTAESNPDNPLGHSATFVAIAAPIISGHEVSWDNGDGFPVQQYTFDDSAKGNDNGVIDVGDLGSQVARSSTQLQNMDVDEFDLRYSVKSEKSRFDFGSNYRKSRVQVAAVTTQQDLGSWGVGNPRDVETYAPGVMEAFCMSCRFDDFPVGNAQVAFRGDATDLFGPLSAAYPGNPISINASADQVDEDILAFYAQVGLESELFGPQCQHHRWSSLRENRGGFSLRAGCADADPLDCR